MPRRADITWSTCIALFWAVSFSANTGEQRQFYRILVYFKRNRHHVKHMHHFGLSKLTSTTGHLTSKSPTTNSSWHSRENKNFESECTKISVEHTLSQIRNLQFSDFLSESRYCTRTSFDGPTPPIGGEKSLHSISFSHGARSPAQDRPESQQVNPFDTSKIIKMATKNQNDDRQSKRWPMIKMTTDNEKDDKKSKLQYRSLVGRGVIRLVSRLRGKHSCYTFAAKPRPCGCGRTLQQSCMVETSHYCSHTWLKRSH